MAKVVKHQWHLFDASNQVVGRFATHIANVLRGKYKPTYTKNADCGDTVVIINAEKVTFTGKKWEQKVYRKHSGFIGGLNEKKASHIREKYPERILLHAVRGMVPKTHHKLPQLSRLHVYSGAEHPFKHIFPNQAIPRKAKATDEVLEVEKHFQVLPEFVPQFEKQFEAIPFNEKGSQDFAAFLRLNHPEEYAEFMAEAEIRLTAGELKAYQPLRNALKEKVANQKIIDHGAFLENKFAYGTKLNEVTLDTMNH